MAARARRCGVTEDGSGFGQSDYASEGFVRRPDRGFTGQHFGLVRSPWLSSLDRFAPS